MTVNRKVGLVLEGGGMRGVFTSGVLDAFMKHNLYFSNIVAVSAGACNGMSYVSHQPRRARMTNIDLLAQYDYISLKLLLSQGNIFDRTLLYEKFPSYIIPFDFNEYFKHSNGFEMVTTNCLTGMPTYLTECEDKERAIEIVKASSALPFVSKIVMIDGIPMLDGGIVDSIPVQRALDLGWDKIIVVLTRNKGWRDTGKDHKIPSVLYRKYPRLRVVLSKRHAAYNEQLELVDRLEREGSIMCIRPKQPLEVNRLEKDVRKLERLYEEGFNLGEQFVTDNSWLLNII